MDKYILLGYVRDSAINVLVHIIINSFLGANECASNNYIVQYSRNANCPVRPHVRFK